LGGTHFIPDASFQTTAGVSAQGPTLKPSVPSWEAYLGQSFTGTVCGDTGRIFTDMRLYESA